MPTPTLLSRAKVRTECLILIGMPGSGKTTIGQALAHTLNWAFLDTDFLIEALYGRRLQDITDQMSKETFLDVEAAIICSIRPSRTVISTGGSAIYRETTMRHLTSLGKIIYLEASLATVEERIADKPERGLAIAPNQTIQDLYNERKKLYQKWANFTCCTDNQAPEISLNYILANFLHDLNKRQQQEANHGN